MNRIAKFIFAVISAGLSIGLTVLALALPSLAHAGPSRILTREYPWSSSRLTLEVPADVRFHPGPSWHLTIRAPERTLHRLVVENGVIKTKSSGCFSIIPFCIGFGDHIDHNVDVELTGPALRSVKVEGTDTIDLDGVHQNRLRLKIEGSATVRGSGSVDTAAMEIDGAGNIHLAQLTETRARVIIRGSGTVDIAPIDSVRVRIDGAGTVRLHSDPPHVISHIFGAGEVVKVPAGRPATARSAR